MEVKLVRKEIWNNKIKPLLTEYLRGTGKSTDSYKKAFRV
jgi:hypothetical protein